MENKLKAILIIILSVSTILIGGCGQEIIGSRCYSNLPIKNCFDFCSEKDGDKTCSVMCFYEYVEPDCEPIYKEE